MQILKIYIYCKQFEQSDDKNNDTIVTKAKHKLMNVVIHWLNKNRPKLCSKLKMNDLYLEEINWAN